MPRVKIEYVVSFSSEDPESPASNLLSRDIGKRRWLCTRGEPSCSVVLQLARAVQIQSVHIGAHHAALVEVLVGLSEKPNDPFEVLVPSCVFVSASDSRRDEGIERVRTFAGEQLAGARHRRWDRLRLVCSQPYNKRCKYGLSFVHVFSLEDDSGEQTAPARLFPLIDSEVDEEEFQPGELFAKHRATATPLSAEAQIRRASSDALKNISDSSTRLTKTSIAKRPAATRDSRGHEAEHASPTSVKRRHLTDTEDLSCPSKKKICPSNEKSGSNRPCNDEANTAKRDRSDGALGYSKPKPAGGGGGGEPHAELRDVLRGVVLALSGYVNPRRARLRELALRLGARYRPDYAPDCTHLICAFPNTPKLKAVRTAGAACTAVLGEWLEECERARRRVSWRPFATEPHLRTDLPPSPETDLQPESPLPCPHPDSDIDTEDEIEQVRAQPDSDGERTEPEEESLALHDRALLPDRVIGDFLEGYTFVVSSALPPPHEPALLERYLRAYGALVLPEDVVRPDSEVHYVVCDDRGSGPSCDALRVRPAWVWRAHELRARPSDPSLEIP